MQTDYYREHVSPVDGISSLPRNDLAAPARRREKPDPPVHHRRRDTVIQVDPDILSGTPVFAGTRVPVQTLLEYLEAGQPLAAFLEDFPTVTREQAVAALKEAKEALLSRARRPTEDAIALLQSWIQEDSTIDGGLDSWEQLKRALDSHRTSSRRLFP